MGAESSGTVILQSKDFKDPPVIDPKFLSHPFDRRVVIETIRDALDFLDQPFLVQNRERLAEGPKGLSDDEILVSSSEVVSSLTVSRSRIRLTNPMNARTSRKRLGSVCGT